MKKLLTICLLFVAITVGATQQSPFDTSDQSLFSNQSDFLPVDKAFLFDFYQNKNTLEISFNIAPGYYLYRHKTQFSATNATLVEPQLPVGIEHEDEYFGVQQIYRQSLDLTLNFDEIGENATIAIKYQGCADKGLCYPPEVINLDLTAVASAASSSDVLGALSQQSGDSSSNNISEQGKLAQALASGSLWIIVTGFFIGGIVLAFTPCVYPMYPILTGIIVGQGDKLSNKQAFRLSFVYVQGMAITYTLLGVVVALAGAQFQAMFQHPIVLGVLSVLFIVLALSMFGVITLSMPASWQTKLNNLSNKQKGGSYWGVFVMGVISGLVASPCTTAPLTGALLYISNTGDVVIGAAALYALSLGMGLPLLALGSSGGKLLPKAGAWMDVIKNAFGFLLLAVPIFLLERFIPAAWTTVLWSILGLSAATYLYVVNQNTVKGFFYGVRSLVVFVLLFFSAMQLYQQVFPQPVVAHQQADIKHFVYAKNSAELDALVAQANANGQTVMVDLYADWCVACKEFEELTFPTPQVQDALSNTLLVQIDLTDTGTPQARELMSQYQIFGLPSILFFDLNGQELKNNRVTGFMAADPFAAHINQIFAQN
ncbi:protein-disulfide reductase DsbD [Thalassotalea agarivorans]